MMRRRGLLLGAVAAVFGVSTASRSQDAPRVFKLGMLLPSTRPLGAPDPISATHLIASALGGMGFVEGRNLVVDRRYGEARVERLPSIARELVAASPDAIVPLGATATRAAMQASATIPVVFYGNFDPVATGLVASLARPGGNLTGIVIAPEGTLAAKKVELLLEAAPGARRIAFLAPPDPAIRFQEDEARKAVARAGAELAFAEVKGGDYDAAFASITRARPQALFVAAHTIFVRDRRLVIERANRLRVPAIYEWREHVAEGGLMSYGSSLRETSQRVAAVVASVFRGAKPAEIPIEQPTTFRLVVNAGAARAMGIDLPKSLLLRADEVIS